MRKTMKYRVFAVIVLLSSFLMASCNKKEDNKTVFGGEYVIQCVITDTTNVQRMRLTVKEPGQTELKVVSPDNIVTTYIAEEGGSFHYFEYEDDGVWTTVLEPQDGINYILTVKTKLGTEFSCGTTFPKRPSINSDFPKFKKAYYPATNDIVENVLWVPENSKIEDFQTPNFLWFYFGQPQENGKLRYSDVVATRSSNRAHFFNKANDNIWKLTCWQEDAVSKIGWKMDIGYPCSSYFKAICLETYPGNPSTDILSYDLVGEYDVDYALKHRPNPDSTEGYVEPLLIADVHLVSFSLNTWLQNAIKDGSVDVIDILHANKAISGGMIPETTDVATGVFGAEAIIRFPIGSGQRDYSPPIELKK